MCKVSYLALGLVLCVAINNDVLGKRHGHAVKNNGGKIVGGYNDTIQNVPYIVYLLVLMGTDYYQCGGSIISSRYILTAAHCLTGVSRVYVRAGSDDSESGGKMSSTSVYRQHPQYNPATSDYDVAVVRLTRPLTLDGTTMKAVTLPEAGQEVPAGTELFVSGWGDTTENGQTSRYLMSVKIPTVSTADCRQAYGQNAITERMICAGVPEGGKDSCQGDSGGPAVNDATGLQVGVVSFGTGCARPGIPGVYTNVSSVRGWIKRNTGV
ncbi:trypsin-7-like [Ostrinia furnacalis]|uniref:trypsin-7-like n=1 Tax=Ostrinia furnacalis TaxID=93504 RepID=UPI00103CB3ED|nr:trypsin-7-like [Ostrinia furnacalis]